MVQQVMHALALLMAWAFLVLGVGVTIGVGIAWLSTLRISPMRRIGPEPLKRERDR